MIFLLQESTCTSRSAYRLAAARKIKKTSTYTLSENFIESASNTSVILDASAPARRAGMTESEWREAIKFDSTDTGWVIMSIGMAIGAGIVFLPVQVGLMGLWVFLLSSIIGYPAMYLFQRLFINTLAESPECKDYPSVISGYLGKNWGILLGALYFVMLVIWMFVYSTAITNDSASYLHTFGVTEGLLSDSPFYGLVLICILFVTVFFYAVSFTLAMGHDEAVKAYEQNISALAIAAQFISGDGAGWVKVVSVILNIFAVMTAFFGVYLGFREATQGIVMNILRRKMPAEKIKENLVQRGIMIFAILLAWSAIVLNAPVLSFTSICSPIFGMVGCLIPAWLVYKVPALHKYKGASLYLIIITGLLLCVSPFLAFS